MNLKSAGKLLKKCNELEAKQTDSESIINYPKDKKQIDNLYNIDNEKENVIPENSENESYIFDKEIIVGI